MSKAESTAIFHEGIPHMDLLRHNLAMNDRVAEMEEAGETPAPVPMVAPHGLWDAHAGLASANTAQPPVGSEGEAGGEPVEPARNGNPFRKRK